MNKSPADGLVCRAFSALFAPFRLAVRSRSLPQYGVFLPGKTMLALCLLTVNCKNPRNLQKVLEFCQVRCYDTTIKCATKSPWSFIVSKKR